jgi:aminoglycoside 3-N-acetyltransferase I
LRIPLQIEIEPFRERSFSVVAYDGGERVGTVFVHELPRLTRGRAMYLVYDVDVVDSHRRRGIATAMLERLAALARARGIEEGFVLTEPDNEAANRLYAKAGGVRSEVVMWDFAYGDD